MDYSNPEEVAERTAQLDQKTEGAMPKDAADIVATARMCGARTDDIITLDDGSRWRLVGRALERFS